MGESLRVPARETGMTDLGEVPITLRTSVTRGGLEGTWRAIAPVLKIPVSSSFQTCHIEVLEEPSSSPMSFIAPNLVSFEIAIKPASTS
jgi:hypothetical protein